MVYILHAHSIYVSNISLSEPRDINLFVAVYIKLENFILHLGLRTWYSLLFSMGIIDAIEL